jgi:leucyl-tRNA synthetase
MDTFVDSSWYYLRYLDPNNTNEPFSLESAKKHMPVDVYIGGIEHAMTHLFVSRLISRFLYNKGHLPCAEPFKRFIAMGMVKGETFKTKSGKYIPSSEIKKENDKYFYKETGEIVSRDMEKMSKSKLNGIDPQSMIEKYGVDFTRLFLVNFVHPKSDRNFLLAPDMLQGTNLIFRNVWQLVNSVLDHLTTVTQIDPSNSSDELNTEIYKTRNHNLNMIDFSLNENFNIPTYLVAVAKINKFLKVKAFLHLHIHSFMIFLILFIFFRKFTKRTTMKSFMNYSLKC